MPASRAEALLRVFTTVDAHSGLRPLHQAIALRAREAKLSGVTVLRGVMGYGGSGTVRRESPLDLVSRQPLVVEIVDTEEKLKASLPILRRMTNVGLVTWITLEVMRRRQWKPRARLRSSV